MSGIEAGSIGGGVAKKAISSTKDKRKGKQQKEIKTRAEVDEARQDSRTTVSRVRALVSSSNAKASSAESKASNEENKGITGIDKGKQQQGVGATEVTAGGSKTKKGAAMMSSSEPTTASRGAALVAMGVVEINDGNKNIDQGKDKKTEGTSTVNKARKARNIAKTTHISEQKALKTQQGTAKVLSFRADSAEAKINQKEDTKSLSKEGSGIPGEKDDGDSKAIDLNSSKNKAGSLRDGLNKDKKSEEASEKKNKLSAA